MIEKMDENQFRIMLRAFQSMQATLIEARIALDRMAEAAEQTAAMQLEMLNHVTGGKTNDLQTRRTAKR